MAKLNGKKKATLYDLFHKNPLAGKGVSKSDKLPRTFKNFFKLSWWHMSQIVSVNLTFIVGNFPIIFLMLGFTQLLNDSIASPASSVFPLLFGGTQSGLDPITAALYGVHGAQGVMSINTTATTVMYCLGALIIFTYGLVNVGTTYIIRNLIKGDPIFPLHDFFYAIKRNFRQGMIMGIVDVIITAVLAYDTMFALANLSAGFSKFMFWGFLLLDVVYFVMRFYIYNLLITFDLSTFKIIKNAFIFAALGLKRNIVALLGIFVLLMIEYYSLILLLPLGIMLPIIVLYGYGAYIGSYAAWPKIKEIMVDPYLKAHPEEAPEEDPDDAVFRDDV